jgi:hypothetical protein
MVTALRMSVAWPIPLATQSTPVQRLCLYLLLAQYPLCQCDGVGPHNVAVMRSHLPMHLEQKQHTQMVSHVSHIHEQSMTMSLSSSL